LFQKLIEHSVYGFDLKWFNDALVPVTSRKFKSCPGYFGNEKYLLPSRWLIYERIAAFLHARHLIHMIASARPINGRALLTG
jgi:hypothetical protein